MKHRTQCEMVLAYLQAHGRIDDTVARGIFGIKRLASRINDLRDAGVAILTLGQYLAPSPQHAPIARFVSPERFADWRSLAEEMGFAGVAAGPYIRSSYRAEALFRAARSPA